MKIATWLITSAVCIPLLTGPCLAAEQETTGRQDEANAIPDKAPLDSQAKAILMRMAERLAQAQGFNVSIRANYDVLQETGQTIEFGEVRKVTLSRPSGLRVETEQSDGDRRVVVFDGKTISVFDPKQNVYAQIDRTGHVDDAVRYLVQDLQLRVPLALLLVTSLPAEFERRVESLAYVELDPLTEVPTDHLAARTQDVDFQVWIPHDGEPLPRRIVITYKNEEGQPQFRAQLSDWDLSPRAPADVFAFAAPPGAERIPFLVRVPKEGAADADLPESKGAEQ